MIKTQEGVVGGYKLNGALVRLRDVEAFFQQDLGKCCCCNDRKAHQMVLVPAVLPKFLHGTGWCCHICQTEFNNAIAVLCDGCAFLYGTVGMRVLQYFVKGESPSHDRMSIAEAASYSSGALVPLVHSARYHMEAVGGQLGNGEIFFGMS